VKPSRADSHVKVWNREFSYLDAAVCTRRFHCTHCLLWVSRVTEIVGFKGFTLCGV